MIMKLLTLAMIVLFVGCGGSPDNGGSAGSNSGGSGSSDGGTSDSSELIELRKVVDEDYNILMLLNISTNGHTQYMDHLKVGDKIVVKTNKIFTSSDVNCKSFNFSRTKEGMDDKIKKSSYESKIESQSNKCEEHDVIGEPELKGDKNYIIIFKDK